MMLEIDGEFFEDPCEVFRATRMLEAIMIGKIAYTQMAMVLQQPLVPPKGAVGGIVNPNTYKGDIVHLPGVLNAD